MKNKIIFILEENMEEFLYNLKVGKIFLLQLKSRNHQGEILMLDRVNNITIKNNKNIHTFFLNEKLTIMNCIQREEIKVVKFLNDNSSRAEFH